MLNENSNACVYIISHQRSANVKKMQDLIGAVTWVVGEGESEAYKAAGAIRVIEGGRLTPSRNAALEDAFKLGFPCIQLSDDLKKIKQVVFYEGGKKKDKPLEFTEAVSIMLSRLSMSPFKLAGIAPTFNSYFSNRETSIRHFVIGDFLVVLPSPLRFDEAMTLKEDYDFTIQHIHKYGGVLRNDDVLCNFEHYTNAGGAVSVRTTEEEQKNIQYLKQKWGSIIKDNAKRPNEILLNLK